LDEGATGLEMIVIGIHGVFEEKIAAEQPTRFPSIVEPEIGQSPRG